jgi:archaellum component FlaC
MPQQKLTRRHVPTFACLFLLDTAKLSWKISAGNRASFMANETENPLGQSDEVKENPVQSSGEVTVGLEHSHHLSEEGYAPPWLRMDPELSRSVLSKTEEELLGTLSALMRHKVEHEKAQRALANTVLEIQQAKQEVAGVKRQIVAAEDELSTRLADHERVTQGIAQARSELQAERSKYLEFQDELIAIRNEIEEAQKEKAAASGHLNELQLQHGTVRAEIDRLKNEIAALHHERHNVSQQIEPIRKELDERLMAREELIEQIMVLERHIEELTSTRDIRTNAQRIALVGRGTESVRDEIERLKTEIERIEKERVRLGEERDRVESEFAGLQSRLSSARSSYAETLEKLNEARSALAVTEKDHNEAVSKLAHVQKQETKPPVSVGPMEEEPEKPEEVVVVPANTLLAEPALEEPPQGLTVKEQMDEPLSTKGEPRPVFAEPAAKEPQPDSALPLLTGEPLPVVVPTWDSYRLESEFFTEETLNANRVAQLISELPGIENVLVVRQRGPVLAGGLPDQLGNYLKTPGRDYERLFGNWPNRTQQSKTASTQTITFQVDHEFLTATQTNNIFLVVSHERPKLHPGVEEKLAVVTEELDKMYPRAGNGIQEKGIGSL